ncbi:MAG TPA: EAL domain-containing protein [Steroidobacteraceae bacterium]|jgi:EAL domain-containing protein (putative c-di-GMP-specific phosphodiesterase class I)/GGDEF domain-containing protein|nr:EAL domain-containing protein [Steroidobacteraceae bacterium]
MSHDPLLELLPDLVLLLRRDGRIIAQGGGRAVGPMRPGEWSQATTELLTLLVRRSIAQRTSVEARFAEAGREYAVHVTAQGPDRAVAVIRAVLPGSPEAAETSGEHPRPQLDRRGFLARLKESMSVAMLREKPFAVAVLYIDGIPDIAQIIATRVSEQIMSAAIMRLSAQATESAELNPKWYLGQLGDNVLAMVIDTSDRDEVDACVSRVCESLREPLEAGGTEFRLKPYAGAAILGLDASTPKTLLDHARAAAAEARRTGCNEVIFHSDTLELRALERLDLARELREAIANGDIRFRYVGRHELRTGRLIACVGYLRWEHPLRGEIRPAEFLRVAESTGLATTLSRAALQTLCDDFATFSKKWHPDVRISFGALRDHLFHQDFLADMDRALAERVPAVRLELRIAEKAFVARDPSDFTQLQKRGVQLVVDEVGRDLGSISSLARVPVSGLQLDRAWVTAIRTDEIARKVCRAGINLALSLGITPIAAGIDDREQRDALLDLGCRFGSGDLYPPIQSDITAPRVAFATA